MLTKQQTQILQVLQKTFGYPLSPEQKRIIEYLHQTNILVNACAGAGKTTLGTFDIMFNLACGYYRADAVLGITFARKARKAMQVKYRHYCQKFNLLALENHLHVMIHGTPHFQTFHSVFYHLLSHVYWNRYHKGLPVLVSWHQDRRLSRSMYYAVNDRSTKHLTKREIIKKIFDVRDKLINLGYSTDGLTASSQRFPLATATKRIKSATGVLYHGFSVDYRNVVKTYIDGKHRLGKIDFNDMKTMISKILSRPKTDPDRKMIIARMSGFKHIYIDEFQDVDPVQWHDLQLLLPHAKDRRVTAIGDDDQSIYNFRGSDPRIIVNLPKRDHTFKTFNLSTNYRTAGNIVSFISPEIESNQERLPKSIRAHRSGGHVVQFRDGGGLSAGESLIKKLLTLIKNPKIDNRQICLLARDNLSREVATDMLANAGRYAKVEGGFIIQDNYQYKSFCGLAEALVYNSYKVFRHYSIRIGFNYYLRHQRAVMQAAGRNRPYQKLSKYLFDANRYSLLKPLHALPHNEQGTEYYARQHDQEIEDAMHMLKANEKTHDANPMAVLFMAIDKLTVQHDQFEIKKGIIEQKPWEAIKACIANNMLDYTQPKEFFIHERDKEKRLAHPQFLSHAVNILSIHAAKGLQFQYVFVYNLNDALVKYPDIAMEEFFGPDCQWSTFVKRVSSNDLTLLLNNLPANASQVEVFGNLNASLGHLANLYPNAYQRVINDGDDPKRRPLLRQFFGQNPYFTTQLLTTLTDAFRDTNRITKTVEEERRLIYVAFTRAVKCTFYDLPKNFCPLLAEANWKLQTAYRYDPEGHRFTTNVDKIPKEEIRHV